ncbi:MAG: IclR family transcriptional regulator [Burkholderiales bacterium]|nr:IclR family transcriptional regulator [Burkholderiales bacterium]
MGATSLRRGLEILRTFRPVDGPLGNKEIAERAGLPKATVARLTYTLVRMGYLRKAGPAGQYHVGDKVGTLGHALLRGLPVRQIARPLMAEFAQRHEISVGLGVGDGPWMVYLDTCVNPKTVAMRLRVGTVIPMASTAMGRAYLHALSPADREVRLRMIGGQAGEQASAVLGQIRVTMRQVARGGFAVSFGEWRPEIFAVGAPLVLDQGATVLALNCSARRAQHTEEDFGRVLGPALIGLATDIATTVASLGMTFWNE